MKDRYSVLILAVVWAILFQLSLEIPSFENNVVLFNPTVVLTLLTIFLVVCPKKINTKFSKHILKAYKIGISALILYIPFSLLFSLRWTENLEGNIHNIFGIIPNILISVLISVVVLMPGILLSSVVSYFIASKLK